MRKPLGLAVLIAAVASVPGWSQGASGCDIPLMSVEVVDPVSVGGNAQSFTETPDTTLVVEPQQEPSNEYPFTITVTLTSL